ncbi:MAG TPA: CHAP domain-containing protein [Mycobacteriales bacterium]|nr:CHAP domain-containing protein [Mycobacteriales bacterium]
MPACLLALPLAIALVGLAAPASASPARKSGQACATGPTPPATRYNRTPSGPGPWHVPLDPCNYEARANGDRSTPYDDCAYWPAEKRPDLFYGAVNSYGYKVAPYGAWNIEIDAKRAGYSVNHRPHVGDIAAWKPNAMMGQSDNGFGWYQASSGGHVSYVEAVNGDTITISDMGSGQSDGGYTFDLIYTHDTVFIHKPVGRKPDRRRNHR